MKRFTCCIEEDVSYYLFAYREMIYLPVVLRLCLPLILGDIKAAVEFLMLSLQKE